MLDPKVQDELEYFQSFFVRGLMAVPKSCPKPSLAYESNLLLMRVRLYSKVLNFVKHILSQDETSLAKQILTAQIENKLSSAQISLRSGKQAQSSWDQLRSKFWFSNFILKVQQTSMSFKSSFWALEDAGDS